MRVKLKNSQGSTRWRPKVNPASATRSAAAGPNSATAVHGAATKAAAVRTALLCRDLLDIAEQYDRLADQRVDD